MRDTTRRWARVRAAVLSWRWGGAGVMAVCCVALVAFGSRAAADPGHSENPGSGEGEPAGLEVRGWTILSDSEADALAVINAAERYEINHLQLSHDIVHDLRHVRDPRRRGLALRLTRAAHEAGIGEVLLWDRALYGLSYYPERFRTGPGGTIDLDDPAFWDWFKADYREMLDLVPGIDGLILTFIETGARAERQHSDVLTRPSDKLAAVVNAVADVVIGERGLTLYARTFAYTPEEYDAITGAVAGFERPEIRLMMKETPHDFFLTHPNNPIVGTLGRPTLVEFDPAAEFNGQGLIANTWPESILSRARDLLRRPNVIGYVARTDRFGDTRIVGRPSEINLLALRMAEANPLVGPGEVYDAFLRERYPAAARPHIAAAFRNALGIVSSVLYTLGTNTANHSKLDYDPYLSSYARHVSGRWLQPPVVRVGHGVDREFHVYKDVIDRLAPPWAKHPGHAQIDEVPREARERWLTREERIDEAFLGLILREKAHGVALAEASLAHIERARPHLSPADYDDLRRYFERTLLTAELHQAVAAAHFGFRVYARGEGFRTDSLAETIRAGLDGIVETAAAIRGYPVKPGAGGWDWVGDADRAMRYHRWITEDGWPAETWGFPNAAAGLTFPAESG